MAIQIPFLVVGSVVLAGNATGRITLPVSANETLEIYAIQQKSTGAFNFTGFSDTQGRNFSNTSSGNGMDSDFVQDANTTGNSWTRFEIPLIVNGGSSFVIDVIDTSGAGNTVEIMMSCKRTLGA